MPEQPVPEYTLVLSMPMVAQIGDIVANAPYKIAAPILAEIQKQINDQNKQHKGSD